MAKSTVGWAEAGITVGGGGQIFSSYIVLSFCFSIICKTRNGVSLFMHFLIGLLSFCIVLNTMNIWMNIYDVVLYLAPKLGKFLRHLIQN